MVVPWYRPGSLGVLLFALIAAYGGCDDGDSLDNVPLSAVDTAGVEVVEIDAAVGHAEWRLTPDPILKIGVVAGDPQYEFGNIVGALRLARDTIVVLDGQAGEIRFYDGLGKRFRTVGGRGEGPGEFEWATDMSRFAGGVQLRASNKRIRFSSSGDLISDESFRWTALHQYSCPLSFHGDDVYLCDFVQGGVALDDVGQAPQYHLLRTDWEGQRYDTLGLFTGLVTAFHQGNDGRLHAVSDPFGRQDLVAQGGSPPVAVALRRDRYELTIMTTAGERLRIVRRSQAEGTSDEEAIDALYRRAAADLLEVTPADVERLFPRQYAGLGRWGLAVDRGGNIWVGVRRGWVEADGNGWDMYEVFETDGSLVAAVAVPSGARLADVGEDYVLLVTSNELDVPFVELYGLVKG